MQTTNVSRKTAWLRVMLLATAAFIFNTTEFIPVGLLTDIGNSFNMRSAEMGVILTIYAWVVALLSLPLMLLTRNIERKKLLIILFVLFTASHFLSSVVQTFRALVVARLGIALAHAVFWAITASLIIRVAPAGKRIPALTMLATGSALAMVLGVPIGRVVGHYLGWRTTFGLIGLFSFVLMLMLMRTLPTLVSENTGSFKSLPHLMRRPALVGLFLLTITIITAHFTTYSYIEPFIQLMSQQQNNPTTLLLLLFGVAGIAGSTLFGKIADRYPCSLVILAIILVVLSMSLLLLASQHTASLFMLAIAWGAAMMIFGLSMQLKILTLAPDARDVAMAVFSALYNIGVGAGALVGGRVSLLIGMTNVGYAGAAIGLIGLVGCCYLFYRYPILRVQDDVAPSGHR